jgi:hypothetical protein
METQGAALRGSGPTVQLLAMLVAATFVLVGIIGFVPGLTSNLYEGLEFAGDDGTAEIFGVFDTSILLNLIHLTFGLVGLALARTWSGARTFLVGGGVVYLVLWLVGLFGGLDWVPVNNADNWLHFVLGVAMIGLGFATTRQMPPARTA